MKKLMKQAQKAQAAQAQVQEKLAAMTLTGTAGGSLVTATVNGQGEILAVKISPAVVDPEDVEGLEDLVLVAVKDAQKKAGDAQQEEMRGVLSGLGGMGF
ncbi:MAG TPA: YbaB/EbfC family nucleoid-associated protein [Deinococcales bacterium]|nr:YbaB/EbfC family nucleoid-associated protein [Deinococcales bacterium]